MHPSYPAKFATPDYPLPPSRLPLLLILDASSASFRGAARSAAPPPAADPS